MGDAGIIDRVLLWFVELFKFVVVRTVVDAGIICWLLCWVLGLVRLVL